MQLLHLNINSTQNECWHLQYFSPSQALCVCVRSMQFLSSQGQSLVFFYYFLWRNLLNSQPFPSCFPLLTAKQSDVLLSTIWPWCPAQRHTMFYIYGLPSHQHSCLKDSFIQVLFSLLSYRKMWNFIKIIKQTEIYCIVTEVHDTPSVSATDKTNSQMAIIRP